MCMPPFPMPVEDPAARVAIRYWMDQSDMANRPVKAPWGDSVKTRHPMQKFRRVPPLSIRQKSELARCLSGFSYLA
jgi:hypothetical protein